MQHQDTLDPFPWQTCWEEFVERWEDIELPDFPENIEADFRHLTRIGLHHLAVDPDKFYKLAATLALSDEKETALISASLQIAGLVRNGPYLAHIGEGPRTVPAHLKKLGRAARDFAAILAASNGMHEGLLNYQRRYVTESKTPQDPFDFEGLLAVVGELGRAAEQLGPETAKLARGRPKHKVERAALFHLLGSVETATGEPIFAVEGGTVDKDFKFTGAGAQYVRAVLLLLYPKSKERSWVEMAKEIRA